MADKNFSEESRRLAHFIQLNNPLGRRAAMEGQPTRANRQHRQQCRERLRAAARDRERWLQTDLAWPAPGSTSYPRSNLGRHLLVVEHNARLRARAGNPAFANPPDRYFAADFSCKNQDRAIRNDPEYKRNLKSIKKMIKYGVKADGSIAAPDMADTVSIDTAASHDVSSAAEVLAEISLEDQIIVPEDADDEAGDEEGGDDRSVESLEGEGAAARMARVAAMPVTTDNIPRLLREAERYLHLHLEPVMMRAEEMAPTTSTAAAMLAMNLEELPLDLDDDVQDIASFERALFNEVVAAHSSHFRPINMAALTRGGADKNVAAKKAGPEDRQNP